MNKPESTTCCIVGGGPAGMMLGYLLARAGIKVIVLEKHADFLRDFRGDTIHPSTLELLHELGLLEEFLPLIDFQAQKLKVNINGQAVDGPDFTHINTKCKFIGFVPQWDLLNFLSSKASQFSGFDLRMNTRGVNVIRERGRVVGVECESTNGNELATFEIRADLVVACDGRASTIRSQTGHSIVEVGIPIDALWFRLDRPVNDDAHTFGWLNEGHMLVTIPRRDHYQVAMVIRKGGFESVRADGVERFRNVVGKVCPPLKEVARELKGWDEVKLLTVQINRIKCWYEEGLLFIGDAAHAMSPVGGVGINLAIQDAVATANALVKPLKSGNLKLSDLAAVQQRREPATRKTQWMQMVAHAQLFGAGTEPGKPFAPRWYVRWFVSMFAPILRRLGAKWIGVGFQPEHIRCFDE